MSAWRLGAMTTFAVVASCGPSHMEREPDVGRGLAADEPPKPRDAAHARRLEFANPGGMWTPADIAGHAATLRALGLAIDPAALTDPTAAPLGAVVSLGGCSGSFVSSEGLIITNHHCATSALQYNATPKQNLLEIGYLARTRADERSNGPAARV